MQRLILTFPTLHAALAAEKVLRSAPESFQHRVTPTPSGLGYSVCGISIEILKIEDEAKVVAFLTLNQVVPSGIHHL